MSNAAIGWNNGIITGALTAGSEAAGLSVANLQDDRGSAATAWQTAAGVTTTTLQIDAGASTTWRVLYLGRTNLTSAATVRWRIGNSAGGASASYDSGVISAGVVSGFGQSVHVAPTDQAGRYVYLNLVDAANPDGFLNVALAFAGAVWQPAINFDVGTAIGQDDRTDEVVTLGGQEYPAPRWQRRRWDVVFQTLNSSDVWPSVMALDSYARRGGNLLLLPDPASADLGREALFGRMKSTSDITYPTRVTIYRSWRARFTERL